MKNLCIAYGLQPEKVEVDEKFIKKINDMKKNGPLVPVTAEDIHVRSMLILGEEETSKGSVHPEKILKQLNALLPGTSMMDGHCTDINGWGRVFDSGIIKDRHGYEGAALKIWYYFLKSEKGDEIAREIDVGIRAEGSISYSFSEIRCNICDKLFFSRGDTKPADMCIEHKIGKKYNKKKCCWYPDGIQAVVEVSHCMKGAYAKTRQELLAALSDEGKADFNEIEGIIKQNSEEGKDGNGSNDGDNTGNGERGEIGNAGGGTERAGDNSGPAAGNDGSSGEGTGPTGGNIDNSNKLYLVCPECYKIQEGERDECVTCSVTLIETENPEALITNLKEKVIGPLKPAKSGVVNNEYFELEDFKELPDGEYIIEPKYDGVYVEEAKTDGVPKFYTDSGNEVTERIPEIVKEAKEKHPDGIRLPGEMVLYQGRHRKNHNAINAFLNGGNVSGKPVFKPFDIVMKDGKKLTKDGTGKRREELESAIPRTEHIHKTAYTVIKHKKGSEDIIKAVKDRMTSEGAMIKNREATYDSEGAKIIYKYKNQSEVDCIVKKVNKKENGQTYECAVGSGETEKTIGTTYITQVEAGIGDILVVSVDYITKKEDGYTWYAPKVISKRDDKKTPDPISTIEKIIKKTEAGSKNIIDLQQVINRLNAMKKDLGLIICGGVVEKGFSTHDVDILTKKELPEEDKGAVREALGQAIGERVDFIVNEQGPAGTNVAIVIQEENAWKHSNDFVIQRHWWGDKEHFDIRFGAPKKALFWGWTLFSKPGVKEGDPKVRCVEKDYHDAYWFTFEGDIPPGKPGNPTKNLVAHMKILDTGKYEFIKRENDFLEVILNGKTWKGRYIFRKINVKQSEYTNDGGEDSKKDGMIWIMWKPKDQKAGGEAKKIGYKKEAERIIFWEE